jgi:AhpD family alkylhydroperoxidase
MRISSVLVTEPGIIRCLTDAVTLTRRQFTSICDSRALAALVRAIPGRETADNRLISIAHRSMSRNTVYRRLHGHQVYRDAVPNPKVRTSMEPRLNLMANETGAKIAKRMFNVSLAIAQSALPRPVQALVMLRVSQINGCGWCVDIHASDAAIAGETTTRLNLVAAWRHASVFSDAERAALALAEEGTRIADAAPGVSDETWSRVREHYDEDQIAALVTLVAMINASNRLGVILNSSGGTYQPGQLAGLQN